MAQFRGFDTRSALLGPGLPAAVRWARAPAGAEVDLKKRDVEIKLLLGCTEEEKQTVCEFHSGTHTGIMLLRREVGDGE